MFSHLYPCAATYTRQYALVLAVAAPAFFFVGVGLTPHFLGWAPFVCIWVSSGLALFLGLNARIAVNGGTFAKRYGS